MKKVHKNFFFGTVAIVIASSAVLAVPEEIEAKGKGKKSSVAEVSTFKELKSAINNKKIKTIQIRNNIKLTNQLVITSEKAIIGNGHTLTNQSNKSEALRFINTTGSLKDVNITGANYAIQVKGSSVNLSGVINLSGNKSGGIIIEKKSGKKHNNTLDITKANLINTNETGSTPTIVEDQIKNSNDPSSIIGLDRLFVEYNDKNQLQRYVYLKEGLKPPNAVGMESPTIKTIEIVGNGYSKVDTKTNTITLTEGFDTSKIVLTMSEDIKLNGKQVYGQWNNDKTVTYGSIAVDPNLENTLIITPAAEHKKATAIGTITLDLDESITIKDTNGNKFDGQVKINIVPAIVQLIQPAEKTVVIGETVELPKTVLAKFSNGTSKEVPVTWHPNKIDTSIPGVKVITGTVEGYVGSVSLNVFVVETGPAQISLFKDSTSSSNKIDFVTISNFYFKNIDTGKTYNTGSIPSQSTRKNQFIMKDLPEGKYTIHFDTPKGLGIDYILLGETYKETVYNAKTNPVIVKKQSGDISNYVKIVLKADRTIAEIKPLKDLSVPVDISYNEFVNTLPKQTTIIDSAGKEHQVALNWDIRPFNFENYNKPGEITLSSEFFTLPLSVSNTNPATRLDVGLKVNFIKK